VALFKNRAALSAELRSISPQASHDSVHIGDLRATKPPDVGRAGHLLFPRPPILLRKRGTLKRDAATDRYRKAQENSMRSHVDPFFGLKHR
jgi:hypothetical protein